MLAAVGYGSLEELVAAAVPGVDPRRPRTLDLPAAADEAEVLAELRALAGRNTAAVIDDRPGLLRHRHPAGDPAQRAGEPGLVHGVHAVPAGDLPGPAGGAAQLPDRWSPTSPACRSPNASLLDEATAAAEAMTLAPARTARPRRTRVRRRRRLPAADDRGGPHPGRAARASTVVVADLAADGLPGRRRCSACCCSTRARPARCATSRRGRSRRRTSAARWSRSPPTCSR